MERTHKVWGERWLIRKDSTHAISFLELDAGYRCSWHTHITKHNLFVVLWGEVGIVTCELGKMQEKILKKGESFTVRPGQPHEFRVYQDSGMIEEMFVEYDESDITRIKEGGSIHESA